MAYAGSVDDKMFVVADGEELKKYEGTSGHVFSPDSQRLTYMALAGSQWTVVVDGKEEKHYDALGEGGPVFSPDSHRVG